MPIYDMLFKLEGMKSLCGDGITDDHLALLLFSSHALSDQRINLSRLKSGEVELTPALKNLLTEEFNLRIAKNVLKRTDAHNVLRADDWDRPLPEFFAPVARALEVNAPIALARARAGILSTLHGLIEYRERNHALLIERYESAEAERYRFPASAEPVDPEELPPTRLKANGEMMAALSAPINDEPSRGWLFFMRDPQQQVSLPQNDAPWDRNLSQLIYWDHGAPFDLSPGYVGALSGYPTRTTHQTGSVIACLLVEPLNSPAVAELLRKPFPLWDGKSAPPLESIIHLITCARRLFQKGASRRYDKGQLAYRPPKLFIRRYRIDC